MKEIIIIGAGIQGMAAARTFKALGYQVKIFEKLDGIGGTWHPDNTYPGLASHGPMKNLEYPDFGTQKGFDPNEAIMREDFVAYLESYADHFDLRKDMTFNSKVTKIHYHKSAHEDRITVTVLDLLTGKTQDHECCHIIYTTLTTVPTIPKFQGEESFAGRIIHTSQFTDAVCTEALRKGKRIFVIGGNKSAADVVSYLINRSYDNYLWLFRQNTWGFNYKFLSGNLFLARIARTLFSNYVKIYHHKYLHFFSALAFLPLRMFKVFINPFPQSHALKVGFFGAIWRPENLTQLRKSHFLKGEIDRINGNDVSLKTKSQGVVGDKADLIVCGTGYNLTREVEFLVTDENNTYEFRPENKRHLFRGIIHPEVPNIIFLNAVTSPGRITISSYLTSLWISAYFFVFPKKYTPSKMAVEIAEDEATLAAMGIKDHSAWLFFQRSSYVMIRRNCIANLKDIDAFSNDLMFKIFLSSPSEVKDIYLNIIKEIKTKIGKENSKRTREDKKGQSTAA